MDSDRLSRWLTLGANIGVLIGLLLVVFEIRQNSDLMRLQFINDDLLLTAESEIPTLGDNPAEVIMKSFESPEDMTYADFRRMDAYLTTKMERLVRRYQLSREGILEDDNWKTVGFAYGWFFGNRFGRLWWEYEGRQAYSDLPELVEHVDQQISQLTDDDATESWRKIEAELKRGSSR